MDMVQQTYNTTQKAWLWTVVGNKFGEMSKTVNASLENP